MQRANDKVGWKEGGKVFYSLASLLYCWPLCRPSSLNPSARSPSFLVPFLSFYCLPVYGWHNLVSQGIIRLNSDSRTVSDVLLMQHNYPSHKAEGMIGECGFPFFCITPAGKTSLLLQYFNTVKATWSKFPSCSCGQLVTHNRIRHSVLNWQFDDRCLLSMRSFEAGQWSLGPKHCNFSKQFVIFKISREWMYIFLATYSRV